MEPIEFKGINVRYAEEQDEYQTLPAHRTPDGRVHTCWKLDGEDMMTVLQTGKIWLSIAAFNKPLQPVLLSVSPPLSLEDV